MLSEYKLRHALSSCKTFLNLAVPNRLRDNRYDAHWWFHMNIASSLLFAVMFEFMPLILEKLRISN